VVDDQLGRGQTWSLLFIARSGGGEYTHTSEQPCTCTRATLTHEQAQNFALLPKISLFFFCFWNISIPIPSN